MKIGDQRRTPRNTPPQQNEQHHHAEDDTEDVAATAAAPARPATPTHHSSLHSSQPSPAANEHPSPSYPYSQTAILRAINTAYPSLVNRVLYLGMLVRDLHGEIDGCWAWCERAVDAGMGGYAGVRETMGELGRLRLVCPRGMGVHWARRGDRVIVERGE